MPVFPPKEGESWYIITEIVQDISITRPVYRVVDKLPGHYWTVAFYTENPLEDSKGCHIGALLCIKNGMGHQFMDGQVGYRIDKSSDALVLPCNMKEIRQYNNELCGRSATGLLGACVVCDLRAKSGCKRCQTRYCSKECQSSDWPNHKHKCSVLKTLHEWNRTDWG